MTEEEREENDTTKEGGK